jgi:hypothetical protein
MTPSIEAEIDRYLRTGRTDVRHSAWPSDSFFERACRARDDLSGAFVTEVRRRTEGLPFSAVPTPEQTAALTRSKTEPMVRGLFPRAEQDAVLALEERSVVFPNPSNIADVSRNESFDHAAWDLANLFLNRFGAELLGPDAP